MIEDYICPLDGTLLSNAPNHESLHFGVVMCCRNCWAFFRYNESNNQIIEADDVVEIES